MNKKNTYTIFGVIALIAIVLVIIALSKGSGSKTSTNQGASIFDAFTSSIANPPKNMNSLDPNEPDQTNFAIASESYDSRLSADGNYIIFATRTYGSDQGLVPNPTGSDKINREQLYRRSLITGAVDLVSSTDGTIANAATWGQSSLAGISSTGKYVAFVAASLGSIASQQVYLKDYGDESTSSDDTLILVSSVDGITGQAGSYKYNPGVSADGRTVCWGGGAPTGNINTTGIYCKFLGNGTTPDLNGPLSLVAEAAGSSEGYAELSANGRYLVYFAGNGAGIKRKDLSDLSSSPVQVSDPATTAYNAKISGDGNMIEWVNFTNGQSMVKNMTTGQTTVASVNAAGQNATGQVQRGGISENGRFVVFSTGATNLITGVTGLQTYMVDLQNLNDGPKLCSSRDATNPSTTFNPDGYYGQGDHDSEGPTVNNSGTLCAFVAASDGGANQLITNTNDNSAWNYNVYVKGFSVASNPQIGFSTQSLVLSSTGKTSATGQITLSNTGTAPLMVSTSLIDASGKFTVSAPTSPIPVNGNTVLTVTFTPKNGKPNEQFNGTINVTHTGTNMVSPQIIQLAGTRIK